MAAARHDGCGTMTWQSLVRGASILVFFAVRHKDTDNLPVSILKFHRAADRIFQLRDTSEPPCQVSAFSIFAIRRPAFSIIHSQQLPFFSCDVQHASLVRASLCIHALVQKQVAIRHRRMRTHRPASLERLPS